MEIISWNIQAGRGTDGVVDIGRIAAEIAAMGDPDIICCQEVAQHFPGALGGDNADQVAQLAARFPDHQAIFGAALDYHAEPDRARFGNLILCRPAALQITLHKLPQPPDPGVKAMPRQATELLVAHGGETLRIVTTHLEYYSARQRAAQTGYLAALQRESAERAAARGSADGVRETACTVLCGDFNFLVDGDEYRTVTDPTVGLADAWRVCHGARPHAPTCGIFDHAQWLQGPHCRDFFFISTALEGRIAAVDVNIDSNASDHQPLRLVVPA